MLISAIFSEKKKKNNQSSKELVSSDLFRSYAFSSVFHENLFAMSLSFYFFHWAQEIIVFLSSWQSIRLFCNLT